MARFHPIGAIVPRLGQGKCPKSAILPKNYLETTDAAPLPQASPTSKPSDALATKGSPERVVLLLAVLAAAFLLLVPSSPVRRLISNPLPDGRAKNMRPSDFDPKELRRGTKHEMEHTTDRKIAERIAMDHLAEDPSYYRQLERMERAP